MKYKCADEIRDAGIFTLYYSVLRKYLKNNHPYSESKEMAFDAVERRYNLSRKRAYAIISKQARSDTQNFLPTLKLQDKSLLEDLRTENEFLAERICQNNKLIEIISDVIETYGRHK